MTDESRLHQLLPWYVNGTLADEEIAGFRAHLDACPSCREELEWLEGVRAQIERHGAQYLDDHPSSERLVRWVRGEVAGPEAERVSRHLALCDSCSTEARWARGEVVSDASGGARESRPGVTARWPGWLPWAAAAAVVLVLFFSMRPGSRPSATGLPALAYLPSVERDAAAVPTFSLGAADPALLLILEVDLPADRFPIRFEVTAADGRRVLDREGIAREALLEQLYLTALCQREDCPPGSYAARVLDEAGEVEQIRRFEIVSD